MYDDDRQVPTSERATIDHFNQRVKDALEDCEAVWSAAEDNQRFVGGGRHQWDPRDYDTRVSDRRPVYTINDAILSVNGMSGNEITQRYQTAFTGREEDDEGWVNVLSEVDRMQTEKAGAPERESDAFRDLLQDRISCLEWDFDVMKDYRGRLKVSHPTVWEMMWDTTALEPGLEDREWDARGRWYSIDEFLALFPGKEKVLDETMTSVDRWRAVSVGQTSRYPWVYRARTGRSTSPKHRAVFVVDYQWREQGPLWVAMVEQAPGVPQAINEFESEDDLNEWLAQLDANGQQGAVDIVGPKDGLKRWTYKRAWIVGQTVLREETIPYGMFTRLYLTSFPIKRPDSSPEWVTLVDISKDNQKLQNAILSLGVAHLQKAQKGGVVYEEDAFVDSNEASRQLATVFPMLKAQKGAISEKRFEFLPENTYPQGIARWLEQIQGIVWRPTGINPATLGNLPDPRRVSGKVFAGLLEAPTVVLAQLFNALKVYRRLSGELRLRMYAEHFSPQRLADIVGPKLAQHIRPGSGAEWRRNFERDVIVDERPASVSEKMQAWDYFTRTGELKEFVLNQLMQPQTYVKMMPDQILPATVRQEWLSFLETSESQRLVEAMQNMPPEQIQQIAQMAMQLLQGQQQQGQPQQGVTQ